VNIDPANAQHLDVALAGLGGATKVTGRVLTAPTVQAVNDFAVPARVAPQAFAGAVIKGGRLSLDLPAKALVVLELR